MKAHDSEGSPLVKQAVLLALFIALMVVGVVTVVVPELSENSPAQDATTHRIATPGHAPTSNTSKARSTKLKKTATRPR